GLRPPHSFPTRRSSDLPTHLDDHGGEQRHDEELAGGGPGGGDAGGESTVALESVRHDGADHVHRHDAEADPAADAIEQHEEPSRSEEHTSELQSRENLV